MECGDQVLRNFLNGLIIHLRGTKENPKNPNDVLAKHKAEIPKKETTKPRPEFKATPKVDFKKNQLLKQNHLTKKRHQNCKW